MKHGDRFTATINGVEVEGRISFSTSTRANINTENKTLVYLCQNICDGDDCIDKLGYNYSWNISSIKKFSDYYYDENFKGIINTHGCDIRKFKILSDRKSRIEKLEI